MLHQHSPLTWNLKCLKSDISWTCGSLFGYNLLVAARKLLLQITVFLRNLATDWLLKSSELAASSACTLPLWQLTKLSTVPNLQSDQGNYFFNLFSSAGPQAKMTTPSKHLLDWQWLQGVWCLEICPSISYGANQF